MREYKENDVVFWRYKTTTQDMSGTRYWCKSQYAIYREVKDGRFIDTYWSGGDSYIFKPNDTEIEVKYLGNLLDYNPCNEDAFLYYDREDIMDIRHPNDSRALFLKKDAKKSAPVMFAALNQKVQKLERDIDYSLREKNRIEEIIKNMEAGCSLEGIYL
jgi:hypothetical protein